MLAGNERAKAILLILVPSNKGRKRNSAKIPDNTKKVHCQNDHTNNYLNPSTSKWTIKYYQKRCCKAKYL